MTSYPVDEKLEGIRVLKSDQEQPKKSYMVVCFLYFLYGTAWGLVVPALPALMLQLTDQNSSKASFYYGLATFFRYFVDFLFSPFLGQITDVKGRKIMFMISFAVCLLESVLLALFPTIETIFITRLLSGMGDTGIATAYTIATDIAIFNGDVVSQKFGFLGAMLGSAFIIGPLAGTPFKNEWSSYRCLNTTISKLAQVVIMMPTVW